jgi:hypothetical protein
VQPPTVSICRHVPDPAAEQLNGIGVDAQESFKPTQSDPRAAARVRDDRHETVERHRQVWVVADSQHIDIACNLADQIAAGACARRATSGRDGDPVSPRVPEAAHTSGQRYGGIYTPMGGTISVVLNLP